MIEIRTPDDLLELHNNLTADYKLMNDIDMSGVTTWIPAGQYNDRFEGTFDGNGYAIKNLTSSYLVENYNGIFGCIGENGSVFDLGVENIDIEGDTDVGGIAGFNFGTIERCYVTGVIVGKGSNADAGGIVAVNNTSTSLIQDCWTNVDVTCASGAGGIAGHNNFGHLNRCLAYGTTTSRDLGGIAGRQKIFPQLYYEDNYWDTDIGYPTSAGGSGCTGYDTETLKKQSTYRHWDFNNVWEITEGVTYPTLIKTHDVVEYQNISISVEKSNELEVEINRSNTVNVAVQRKNNLNVVITK